MQKSFITMFKGLITAYADYLVANNIKGIFSKISFFRKKKYFYLTKRTSLCHLWMSKFCCRWPQKCRIFSCERPFYERAVSNLERSMHISLWVYVAHSSFIEGSFIIKNMASGQRQRLHLSWLP
jgi:hypothetical protein